MGTPGRDEKKKSFSFACVVGVPRNESARRNCGVKGGGRGQRGWFVGVEGDKERKPGAT